MCFVILGNMSDVVGLEMPADVEAPTAKEELVRLLALRMTLEQTTGDKTASTLDQHLDDTRRKWKILDLGHQIDKLTAIVLAQRIH